MNPHGTLIDGTPMTLATLSWWSAPVESCGLPSKRLLEYRDMCTIIRDRVQNAIKKGMTLQQVKGLKPSVTYEYEPRFNRDPAWTAEMFVEAIYKNLSVAK